MCFRSVKDSFTAERAHVTFGLVKVLWLVCSGMFFREDVFSEYLLMYHGFELDCDIY